MGFPIKKAGRKSRDRTDDLMLPKHALYHLSYFPIKMEPQTGFEPAFSFQLPFSPFVAEGDTGALNGSADGI